MEIQSISKEKREVVVALSVDDLSMICNVFYEAFSDEKKERFYKLYEEMMTARDLCQYGHIDNHCLSQIIACRNKSGNPLAGI